MILVITSETTVQNEAEIINQMFQEGLDLLHIRKPMMNEEEMQNFLSGIHEEFYPQLVLHKYDNLSDYRISRFHFRESDRIEGKCKSYPEGSIISTSVHNIQTFNALEREWDYAWISPFFPSISKKGYGEHSTVIGDIKYRNNHDVKLIALGGINEKNIREIFENGVDGAALLGGIWQSDEPVNSFKKCRKEVFVP